MKPWRQGKLLYTDEVCKMWADDRKQLELKESCEVYESFSAVDDGKSRVKVVTCATPEIAKHIVDLHNQAILDEVGKTKTP